MYQSALAALSGHFFCNSFRVLLRRVSIESVHVVYSRRFGLNVIVLYDWQRFIVSRRILWLIATTLFNSVPFDRLYFEIKSREMILSRNSWVILRLPVAVTDTNTERLPSSSLYIIGKTKYRPLDVRYFHHYRYLTPIGTLSIATRTTRSIICL